MNKIEVKLSVTYNLKGRLLKEYLEWLGDYKDTPKMRKAFVIDQFVNTGELDELIERNLDPKTKLTAKEVK
jgi:hypothetical protein